ncbi:MAG: amino acid racemase [Acidobacteriota bacterium]
MKRIGLIGGMTPESTIEYYRALIRLGRGVAANPLDNPVLLIYSVNLSEIFHLQEAGRDDEVVEILGGTFDRLRGAGAEVGSLTANTPHVYFDRLAARAGMPLVSILDATFERTTALGCRKVLLLGTRTTMASPMYPRRLAAGDIQVLVPDDTERAFVNRTIYEDLAVGLTRAETRRAFVEICERHVREDGADGVILGCTEIPLLLKVGDVSVPMIDTTQVHAEAIFAAARAEA